VSGTEGEITSPNYPDSYPHNTRCLQTIQVPEGMQLRYRIESLWVIKAEL